MVYQDLKWRVDEPTRQAALQFQPVNSHKPKGQYHGRKFEAANWSAYLRDQDLRAMARECVSAPEWIIEEFRDGHYLRGLALTISWGAMGRTRQRILKRSLQDIHDQLELCRESIRETKSIETSWEKLTAELGWTNVLSSKVLHFLCRSLDFRRNPPVPIDGGIILKQVWPRFKKKIPPAISLEGWKGNSYEAYGRYMTAINVWAKGRNWTTTEMETTLYHEYTHKLVSRSKL
jgi:hypothetical protein